MSVLGASSVATTRLDHIRANLAAIRQRVGERLVLAAVKADAYGHGAVAVARMVERTGAADWLGVATVGEGLELRAAGIGLPILKLSVARGEEVRAAVAAGMTLCVTDAASIEEEAAAASDLGTTASLHLKVDTGMRRIGCEPEEAPGLARLADATAGVRLDGLFSHLPISDSPRGDAFTSGQIDLFRQTAQTVEAVHGPLLKHLANSGAVLGHPDAWFDLVRPGIIVYGAYPDPAAERSIALAPGLEWRTRVTFVKRVRAGETVGYGRTWTAPRDTWIGTVPVGYGDGYSRLLSSRGRMLIGGRSYPIAGRVCMDQTMVDLGPATEVAVGDEVVLVGRSGAEEITTSELADAMGTIPYEVTCLITRRVARDQVPQDGIGS
ncbi:alanine racemase [Propionicimonas sp.]|uniref:alanine racemase n=1 Tax=Propionicimonas sp. TaxID=1955623 RepID=UPI0039E6CB56